MDAALGIRAAAVMRTASKDERPGQGGGPAISAGLRESRQIEFFGMDNPG
jgi:hypothetical protein